MTPPKARTGEGRHGGGADDGSEGERPDPPPRRQRGDRHRHERPDGGATGSDRAGVVGAEAVGAGDRDGSHRRHGRTPPQGVRGDQPGEGGRRTERRDGDHAQHDRAAQRGDPVGAVARVLQDLEAPLAGRPAGDGVGGVGQAVLVEGAGDEDADEHPDRRGDGARHEVRQPGDDPTGERADQRPDDGEPDDDGGGVGRGRPADRHPGQELDGADEAGAIAQRISPVRRTTRRTSGPR